MRLFAIRKIDQQRTLFSHKNLTWFPEKCFSFILSDEHFTEVVEKKKQYLIIC